MTRQDARDFLNIAHDLRIRPQVTEYRLENVNKALLAAQHAATRAAGFDETKWGQVVSHLRTAGVITIEEEKGLAGVFGFVSPGAHVIVHHRLSQPAGRGR
jgi:hypothetical protein